MDLVRKTLRGRLGHKPLAALWMSMGSPSLVELAGAAQPDAIVIDMQHGLFDRATLEYALGAGARHLPPEVQP